MELLEIMEQNCGYGLPLERASTILSMTKQSLKVLIDPKHKRFADNLLKGMRKGAAAQEAGYAKNSSHVTASKLLKRPDILAYLAEQGSKVSEQTEDLQARVVRELEAMAFANITDFISIDKDGKPQVDFSDATPEQLKAITRIASKSKVTKTRSGDVVHEEESAFVMADKYRGLELLGNHLGMFKQAEQRVVLDVADRLLAARQRLRELSDGVTE